MLTTKAARASSTEQRILDAAFALAALQSLESTSMEAVADRAGVGRATLYRHFKNRSEIIERLIARERDHFTTALARDIALAPNARVGLVDAFETALRVREHPLLGQLRRTDPGSLIEVIQRGEPSTMEIGRILWAHQVRVVMAAGLTTDIDPDVVGDILMHTLVGYLIVPATPFDLADPARRRRLVEAIVDGLVPPIEEPS